MENSKSSYKMRIGGTTFIVTAKAAETAKKPLETAIRDLCLHEITGNFDGRKKI